MYIVVLMTCPNADEAKTIVDTLLNEKLIACANLVNPVRSLYWWEGKVNNDEEVLVVMKTRQDLFAGLEKTVKSLHSYSVPEIIALPIAAGNQDYLDWIDQSTGGIER
ncbi:MAG: divalent-cation tolerance protein CutA [Candidatus Omnitrophica bacterium]|nr:divalent-cation tolerance protein CutA [Candidatus Omnitrophota bacterium]MCB9719392.1 divalent-cation tolerance protein CutA [Candidatus Omnitrophota bacterium]